MMNSLVDDYLYYMSRTIAEYTGLVTGKESNISLEKLSDIVYDYLNEVFLLERKIDDIKFSKIINIKLQDQENSLFNLFMQYGLIDRIKIKDKSIKKSYMFVVDAINYFVNVEKYICKNSDIFYDQVFQKLMKSMKFIDKDSLKKELIDKKNIISLKYDTNCKMIKEMYKKIDSFNYTTSKLASNAYYVNVNYINELLLEHNNRECEVIINDYQKELYLNSLENLSIDILKELFEGKNNDYFIFVPDYMFKSKNAIKKIVSMYSVYALNKSVCFMFAVNSYIKHLKLISECFNEMKTGVYIDQVFDSNYNLDDVSYLMIQYDEELDKVIDKYYKNTSVIINGKLKSENKNKLADKNIKYYSNIKVNND